MSQYICVDIGGTSIKHGVLDENAIIKECNQTKTEAWLGGAAVLDKVKTIGKQYKEQYENIEGICISTAGMVDPEEGKIVFAGELMPGYTGTCIKKELEKALEMPCEVENDVNCAGLAEYVSGSAKESHIMFCATVGTGIGGCAIVNGRVFHGASNSACEVGYIPMGDSDFQTLGASSILVRKVVFQPSKKCVMYLAKGWQQSVMYLILIRLYLVGALWSRKKFLKMKSGIR